MAPYERDPRTERVRFVDPDGKTPKAKTDEAPAAKKAAKKRRARKAAKKATS